MLCSFGLQAADSQGANVSKSWHAGTGTFKASPTLGSVHDELIAEVTSTNATRLWNTSSSSVWQRVEPSGFLPTSVSGGYGGITSEYVRDGAGMIIGMLELGPAHWATASQSQIINESGAQIWI